MPREIDMRGVTTEAILWRNSLILSSALEHLAALVRVAKFWAVSVASLVAPWENCAKEARRRQRPTSTRSPLPAPLQRQTSTRRAAQGFGPKTLTQDLHMWNRQRQCDMRIAGVWSKLRFMKLIGMTLHQLYRNHFTQTHGNVSYLVSLVSWVPNVLAIHPMVEKGPLPWMLRNTFVV